MHTALTYTASTCEPLTLDEARSWLRLGDHTNSEEDAIVQALVSVCRRRVEDHTKRLFYQSTCALHVDAFPEESTGVIRVPVAPLVSVASITSYDSTDGATVMSTSDYTVDTVSEPGRISLRNSGVWPTDLRTIDGGIVSLTAGYSTSTSDGSTGLPDACAPMVSAVKLLLAHLHENRQEVVAGSGASIVQIPLGVDYLLSGLILPEVEG